MEQPSGLIVVLVTPNGPGSGGGTQQVLRRMVPLWVAEGRHVTLLTHPVDNRWDGLPNEVRVVALPAPNPRAMHSGAALGRSLLRILRTAQEIRRTVRSRPQDVVLPFLPGASILTLTATLGLGARVIACERNDPTRQPFSLPVQLLRRLLYRRSTGVTVNSDIAGESFARLLHGRVPVHMVFNPLPEWPATHGADREDLVLSIGRLVPQKRHDDVIRAFARLTESYPSWQLEIVGDGPERAALKRLVETLGIRDRVTLRGHVNDVRSVLARARVLVLASDYEGTPNALLEGLLSGVRGVVSAAVPALPAPLDPTPPLERFAVGDVAELQEILDRIFREGQEPDRRARLLGAAEYAAQARESWARVIG